MKRITTWILLISLALGPAVYGQQAYEDSIAAYLKDYIKNHEVVATADKGYLQFFPIDKNYRVVADFKKSTDAKWFLVETSGRERKTFRVYGTVTFLVHDTVVSLNLYQGQALMADPKYGDYLALMFTDKTTGLETYDGGRYIDLVTGDIKNNRVIIDFNKAYNPYCAYVKNKYNCPIPPPENNLPVQIQAGKKNSPRNRTTSIFPIR